MSDDEAEVLKSWVSELWDLDRAFAKVPEDLGRAEDLLQPVQDVRSNNADNAHLVKTLRASAILHSLLLTRHSPDERRKPAFLLSLAYTHMPIQGFQGFRELYLEQCIREFPASKEAQQAFVIYKEIVETDSTGSGGLQLDSEDRRKLLELRNLAYGTDEPFEREPIPPTL